MRGKSGKRKGKAENKNRNLMFKYKLYSFVLGMSERVFVCKYMCVYINLHRKKCEKSLFLFVKIKKRKIYTATITIIAQNGNFLKILF